MPTAGRPTTRIFGGRGGPFLAALSALVGLAVTSTFLADSTVASAAVAGSKTKITTSDCSTTSCLITLRMKGVVKVTPTGTVTFLLGHSVIAATGGGACAASPMIPLKTAEASATCDATDLPQGRHVISVTYSGDSYFDPSTTTRAIRVKAVSSP